jgi:transposase
VGLERIVISKEEAKRFSLLTLVNSGSTTLVKAATAMGVSYRQAKRLKKKSEDGIQGLVHGNRGRTPANKTDEQLLARVIELSGEKYSKFNDRHFTEMLLEREGITLGRETVRLLRRGAGIKPKRKRRGKKHHGRRPRRPAEGMMMLWDGSPHHWFGKEYSPCCLMAAVDDANGKALALRFTDAESSWAYLDLLEKVVRRHGIPASVYQDRHSALKRNDSYWSIEEQLAGRQDPTQVGAALEALEIQAIFALTPQAKGRVEKLFQTLQDRLVAMLDLEGIRDANTANRYIEEYFLEYFNSRFAVEPEEAVSVWRKPNKGLDLERILSLRYEATVANDNAVRLQGLTIDIPPGPGGRGYAGARAEVRQMLDGSWRVYYQDKPIATAPATEIAEPIRARNRRKGLRAATDTQWVYLASAQPADGTSAARSAIGSVRRAKPGSAIGATRIA